MHIRVKNKKPRLKNTAFCKIFSLCQSIRSVIVGSISVHVRIVSFFAWQAIDNKRKILDLLNLCILQYLFQHRLWRKVVPYNQHVYIRKIGQQMSIRHQSQRWRIHYNRIILLFKQLEQLFGFVSGNKLGWVRRKRSGKKHIKIINSCGLNRQRIFFIGQIKVGNAFSLVIHSERLA